MPCLLSGLIWKTFYRCTFINMIKSIIRWPFATRFRRWLFAYFPLLLLIFVFTCDLWIGNNAKGRMYNRISDVPENSAALVLGTSPGSRGKVNLYYKYRMQAAADLWKSGKVDYIIVSGDNSTVNYDEATYMKKTLNDLGIPDSVITLDYAGFRTLDSVVRAYWVFGQKNIVIVSQPFHNERAIFIADHFGINACAYNAKDVPDKYGWKTSLREYLARVNAVLDLFVFQTTPKYPGPPEPIR